MEIKYKWLLDFCSYYDGKENNEPDHTSGMMWEYERVWVMRMQNWDFSLGEVNEYIHYGLGDFNADDGVPISFKTLLFFRYMHWSFCGTAEGFKEWYLATYKPRLAEKKLSKGKKILNRYRLAFLEYRCNWESIEKTPEMDYMFDIANAVDAEHGFDKPIAEGVMCRALAHADTHGYTIEIVPDSQYIISKQCDGWKYHPEFKEIRERALAFLKKELPDYDNAEYLGRWKGKYVYEPFNEEGQRLMECYPYILLDKESEELFIDRSLFGENEPVKPKR